MMGLVFSVVFFNAADFRGDSGEEFSVHWQIFFRLGICACCGLVGLAMLPHTLRHFLGLPGMFVGTSVLWILTTTPMSIAPAYSAAAEISLACVVCMIPAAMRTLGGRTHYLTIAFGLAVYLIGSWIAYLVFPEVGVFKEQVTQTEVVYRMGGLGHPNELGAYAAYCVIAFVALWYGRHLNARYCIAAIGLGMVTLVACYSRTSIIITAIGVAMVLRDAWFRRWTVLVAGAVAVLSLVILLAAFGSGKMDWFLRDLAVKVSKSGNTDELTTATGRTEIWAYAVDRIAERPLFGYGYGTGRFVMEEHSYHCHNIILNITLYTGLIGGGLLLMTMVWIWTAIAIRPRYEIDGWAVVILLGGMIEGMLVSSVPAASMMIWVTIVFWRQMGMSLRNPSATAAA